MQLNHRYLTVFPLVPSPLYQILYRILPLYAPIEILYRLLAIKDRSLDFLNLVVMPEELK